MHYDLPNPKTLKAVELVFKNYHKNVLGTLHGKQVLVDGELAMVGSKNIDADMPEEIMVVLEGRSFVAACRADFGSIWGSRLPGLRELSPGTPQNRTGSDMVPIVMMGRTESGSVIEHRWKSPQNIGWLAMMDAAESDVYIQTMLFNAEPIFDKVLETVKRGVNVTMVITYKYSDLAVRMDQRGLGHNRGTVAKLYAALSRYPNARKRLRVCWWIGHRPTTENPNLQPKPREGDFTHAKAVIVDQRMVALGSANMDTISLFNQREANFMIDDPTIAKDIYSRLHANQLSLEHCYHYSY